MAFLFYLNDVLLPVAPSKLDISIENKNDTIVLINDGEINILKKPGLTDISFDILLPNVKYPFAVYEDGFNQAYVYLDLLEQLKVNQKPFRFMVTRQFPKGGALNNTNMNVSLEDYKIKEDEKQGFDVLVSVKLKQYKEYGTKTPEVSYVDGEATVSVEEKRETVNSPEPTSAKKYTVVKGDTLWGLSKRFYGDGSKYPKIADSNKLTNPNLIQVGQVLTIPAV